MKVSEQWLREWVALDLDSDGIAEVLTMAGLEVDSMEQAGPQLPRVVVGKVLSVTPHPDADRLTLCAVDNGEDKTVPVVCGASNVAAGMHVPLALPGADLPGGLRIEARSVRGVASAGMLCSATELGIAEHSEGLLALESGARPGQSIADHLGFDDTLIDIDLTPNRGDCLSILGIARELSVLTGARLLRREVNGIANMHRERIPVTIGDPRSCPRYVGRVVTDIDNTAVTPLWMRERLRRCGIRPISLVVDITNYVMLELGQPMHAFDRTRLDAGIVVRRAKAGEKCVLLDDSEITLDADTLIIADRQRPVALAGIMGGAHSAIDDASRAIVLESAHFAPGAIAGRARHFGLHTDSSHRFERGVDPQLPAIASQYASWWLHTLAGGRPGPLTHAQHPKYLPQRRPVSLRQRQAERLLGVKMSPKWIGKTLRRIAPKVTAGRSQWTVTPPSYRFDLQRECDLIEELARVDGYHRIEAGPSVATVTAAVPRESHLPVTRLRRALVDRGYHEVVTYSFIDPQLQQQVDPDQATIRLNNPLAQNMSVMRTSLWPGLLQTLQLNQNRQQLRVRVFEIGKTFHRPRPGIQEINRLAGLAAGPVAPLQWGKSPREVDFYDLKGDIEALLALTGQQKNFTFNTLRYPALHPGQAAEIRVGGKQAGVFGRLHPRLQADLDLEGAVYLFEFQLEVLRDGQLPRFREFSRFPAIRRDLAVVVDEGISANDLSATMQEAASGVLSNLELFDVYRGEHIDFGRKSMAFALTFQDSSRTLKDEEVDKIIETVRAALADRFGADFRS